MKLQHSTDHDAVASIFESGENWQKAMGLSSPIWLQELVSCYTGEREGGRMYTSQRSMEMRDSL